MRIETPTGTAVEHEDPIAAMRMALVELREQREGMPPMEAPGRFVLTEDDFYAYEDAIVNSIEADPDAWKQPQVHRTNEEMVEYLKEQQRRQDADLKKYGPSYRGMYQGWPVHLAEGPSRVEYIQMPLKA